MAGVDGKLGYGPGGVRGHRVVVKGTQNSKPNSYGFRTITSAL